MTNITSSAFPYTSIHTLIDLFEEQVAKSPDGNAVIDGNDEISFRELNERINSLAHHLISLGVKDGMPVPIYLDRSINMVIGILGILKAGGAFVPIDINSPEKRIQFILDDISAEIIIIDEHTKDFFKYGRIKIVDLAKFEEEIIINSSNIHDKPGVVQLAYIIYTSGSSGFPKGVMVEHGSMYNYLEYCVKTYVSKDNGYSGSYFHLSYSFDASITALFVPLITGYSVIIADKDSIDVFRSPLFKRYAPYHFLKLTPSHMHLLKEVLTEDYYIADNLIIGGEKLHPSHINFITKKNIPGNIFNEYGPTEATVGCSTYVVAADDLLPDRDIPIGKPIDNIKLYVVDEDDMLLPIGVVGELYIGGPQVTRGYLNQGALTNEKFIDNPFDKTSPFKIYKTGDFVKKLSNGSIQYIGRIDDQTKIRGYRVEPGEVESVINNCDEVITNSIIISKDVLDNNNMVSYYVPNPAIVKLKERQLYINHTEGWKEVYESEYSNGNNTGGLDEEFDITGWEDSFTGNLIPVDQMREWKDDIIDVILSEPAGRVFEIGCGSGLIYYALTGIVDSYTGTDLSSVAVDKITKRINEGRRKYGITKLKACAAHEISLQGQDKADTVIINSVIQYFPGEDYLTEVLEKSIGILKGNGRIVVGDVRDNRLLRSFKGRLFLNKLKGGIEVEQFEWGLNAEVLNEEELCVSPEYFYNLKNRYPEITHIEVTWKQGDAVNELFMYRYNVIIYVGIKRSYENLPWINWEKEKTLSEINLLKEFEILCITNVPNFRLYAEERVDRALHSKEFDSVNSLLKYADQDEDEEYRAIRSFLSELKNLGYTCKFLVSSDPFKFDLVVSKIPFKTFLQGKGDFNIHKSELTNIPLFNQISQLIEKDIKIHLEGFLPGYMMPSHFIPLEKLPLNKNGKVDKSFLSRLEIVSKSETDNFIKPSTPIEKSLGIIWQDVLEIERISVHDDFFQLGGHSLLAVRVVSAVRKQFKCEISLQDFFLNPTISSLSVYIGKQNDPVKTPVITPQTRKSNVPLSFAQERLWFLDKLHGTVHYHIPFVFRLKDKIDLAALSASFKFIVDRHEILRTVIIEKDGIGYQEICTADDWEMICLSEQDLFLKGSSVDTYISEETLRPFDLSRNFLLRVNLIALSDNEYVLFGLVHHIAFDGWSISVMAKELSSLYRAFSNHQPITLQPLYIQYSDYTLWQRGYLKGEFLQEKLDYWHIKLKDIDPLDLNTDFPRQIFQSIRGNKISKVIPVDVKEQLLKLGQNQGATLYMTLIAVFKVLLFRYTNHNDICIGSPVAGRQQQELESMIGFFVNTLAIRSYVSGENTFNEFLTQVKTVVLEALDHQEVPFEKIVEVLGLERDMSRTPIFQIQFALQNTPEINNFSLDETTLIADTGKSIASRFDINFNVTEIKEGLHVSITYCSDLFKQSTIEQLLSHYEHLLTSVIHNPDIQISHLKMLTEEDEDMLINGFNQTKTPYLQQKTLVTLFEEQVLKSPDHTALIFEGNAMSYRELNDRSNCLAHYLIKIGVNEETLVPICIDRSLEMIIGILGILKAGGAYVPVSPDYPGDRIRYILDDTDSKIAVSNQKCEDLINNNGALSKVILIDADWEEISQYSKENSTIKTNPFSLMYVIYTSGSTGRPKGVMVEHGSLSNFVTHQSEFFNIGEDERVLQFYDYCFDPSVEQIFLPLINGSICVLIADEIRRDIEQFEKFLVINKITHLQATPGFLNNLQGDNYGLRRVIAGGEVCSRELRERWRGICNFYNKYGPTETAITATEYFCPEDLETDKLHSIPIGKPVSNTEIYILDEAKCLVPVGVTGEIYIGGVQVARGYLNRPELTAECFVENPFAENRIYKTGDLGAWLQDGNIMYTGRRDDQVKIRGYRVEPGEIETAAQESTLIKQCVVIGKSDNKGGKRLVIYLVPKKGYSKEKLKEYLTNVLPGYMVPEFYLELERMPFTTTGKIDKNKLLDLEEIQTGNTENTGPVSEIESQLIEIWKNLLEVEEVNVGDDFFQLGGHSLLATRVVSVIRKKLKVELSVNDFFTHTTISSLAMHLEENQNTSLLPALTLQPRIGNIPLSFAQERLWFIDQLQGSVQYHMPWIVNLSGDFDKRSLENAFKEVVKRHEVLRTVIRETDGKGFQFVKPAGEWRMNQLHEQDILNNGSDLETFSIECVTQPFNLSEDFMFRVTLIEQFHDAHKLIVILHHIASDGWSKSILIKELNELYRAYVNKQIAKLPLRTIQYADYSIWQRNYINERVLDKKFDYWKKKLANLNYLDLPTDFPRPVISGIKGSFASLNLSSDLSRAINDLSRVENVTSFMTLLGAFKILVFQYSGQTDICVGSPIAGRQSLEVEGLIGFFVNTLAIRSEIKSGDTIRNFLQQLKTTLIEAYENQEVPFDKVVEVVSNDRAVGKNPIFPVLFGLQNSVESEMVELGDVKFTDENIPVTTSIFDLEFSVREVKDIFQLKITYSFDLYEQSTIERMLKQYARILEIIVDNPGIYIDDVSLNTADELDKIINEFNSTDVFYPEEETIVTLFQHQVSKTPLNSAVEFEGTWLNYNELNERSGKLVYLLQNINISPGKIVAIYLDPSLDMIISILGILKAGAVYVPIDPEFPRERISYILEDSGASAVVTMKHYKDVAESLTTLKIICLEDDDQKLKNSDQSVSHIPHPDMLAYIIYTSGSTGKPKGVEITHRSLCNRLQWTQRQFALDQTDVVLNKTTFCFDVSVWELLWPLICGSKLVLAKKNGNKNLSYLKELIVEKGITVIHFVPSMIEAFINEATANEGSKIRIIICSGETLTLKHVRSIYEKFPNISLFNLYGPTEATIDVTYFDCAELKNSHTSVPIGKPVDNTQLYILNNKGMPVPIGVYGEIYIGGIQVARGYVNNQALTQQKFLRDTFKNGSSGKLFRTGDVARYLPDGNIQFAGRNDNQIKINGHRVELGEIEHILELMPFVDNAIVLYQKMNNTNMRLVAYLASSVLLSKSDIQLHLRKVLPEYMIPGYFLIVREIPLLANGKTDKNTLLEMSPVETVTTYDPPTSDFQLILADIWQGLLGIDKIGINDNFFELGGNSVISLQIISRMRRHNYQIEIGDIFIYQTIALISSVVESRSENHLSNSKVITNQVFELSSFQKLLIRSAKENVSYRQLSLKISKQLSDDDLENCIAKLISHHDSLILSYRKNDEVPGWMQFYSDLIPELIIEDLSIVTEEHLAENIQTLCANHLRTFNIEEGRLLKFILIKTSNECSENQLIVLAHMLIADKQSMRIIHDDFIRLFDAITNKQSENEFKKNGSFQLWCNKIDSIANSSFINLQKLLPDIYCGNMIPANSDMDPGEVESNIYDDYISLDVGYTNSLFHDVPAVYNATMEDLVITSLTELIHKRSGDNEILTGLMKDGRKDHKAQGLFTEVVGCFTTLDVVNLSVQANVTARDRIINVKEQLRIMPHIKAGKEFPRPEKLHVLLEFFESDTYNEIERKDGLELSPAVENEKCDLSLISPIKISFKVDNNALIIRWQFSNEYISQTESKSMMADFITDLKLLIDHCVLQRKNGVKEITPSDFSKDQEITLKELDSFYNNNLKNDNSGHDIMIF